MIKIKNKIDRSKAKTVIDCKDYSNMKTDEVPNPVVEDIVKPVMSESKCSRRRNNWVRMYRRKKIMVPDLSVEKNVFSYNTIFYLSTKVRNTYKHIEDDMVKRKLLTFILLRNLYRI